MQVNAETHKGTMVNLAHGKASRLVDGVLQPVDSNLATAA